MTQPVVSRFMGSMGTYYDLTLANVPREHEDLLTGLCFQFGALGISENLPFKQNRLEYPPETLHPDTLSMQVYFSEPPPENLLSELRRLCPSALIYLASESDRDWLAEWKKSFQAFPLIDDLWVVPSWTTPPSQSRNIFIDPGMAFGTGTHETTQLAAKLIYQSQKHRVSDSALDVGTGTGILAMVLGLTGTPRVLALDTDTEAQRVAVENFTKNSHISGIELTTTPLEKITEHFSLVVANIVDGVLLSLREDLVRRLKPSGTLILSGILKENAEEFRLSFLSQKSSIPLRLTKEEERGEWVAMQFEAMQFEQV